MRQGQGFNEEQKARDDESEWVLGDLPMLSLLNDHCPSLVSLAAFSESEWERRRTSFNTRMKGIKDEWSQQGFAEADTTIYDLLIKAYHGAPVAIGFLRFIETICTDCLALDTQHRQSLKEKAREILQNFSKAKNLSGVRESKYLDFIGELLALLTIVKNSQLQVESIHPKLPNGKCPDFLLFDPKSQKRILVEVLNISHVKSEKIQNDADLEKFLSGRIEPKLQEKIGNMVESGIQLVLLPIIWCRFDELREHASAFETIENKYRDQILMVCMVVQYLKEDGSYDFRFSTVSSLASTWCETACP